MLNSLQWLLPLPGLQDCRRPSGGALPSIEPRQAAGRSRQRGMQLLCMSCPATLAQMVRSASTLLSHVLLHFGTQGREAGGHRAHCCLLFCCSRQSCCCPICPHRPHGPLALSDFINARHGRPSLLNMGVLLEIASLEAPQPKSAPMAPCSHRPQTNSQGSSAWCSPGWRALPWAAALVLRCVLPPLCRAAPAFAASG